MCATSAGKHRPCTSAGGVDMEWECPVEMTGRPGMVQTGGSAAAPDPPCTEWDLDYQLHSGKGI